MINFTINQFVYLFIFVFCGIIFAIIYQAFSVLLLKKYQKILIKNVFIALFYAFFTIFFTFLIIFFNFGKYNFALISAYIFGFILTRAMSNQSVVFLQNKWYNHVIKLKNKNESKSKQN